MSLLERFAHLLAPETMPDECCKTIRKPNGEEERIVDRDLVRQHLANERRYHDLAEEFGANEDSSEESEDEEDAWAAETRQHLERMEQVERQIYRQQRGLADDPAAYEARMASLAIYLAPNDGGQDAESEESTSDDSEGESDTSESYDGDEDSSDLESSSLDDEDEDILDHLFANEQDVEDSDDTSEGEEDSEDESYEEWTDGIHGTCDPVGHEKRVRVYFGRGVERVGKMLSRLGICTICSTYKTMQREIEMCRAVQKKGRPAAILLFDTPEGRCGDCTLTSTQSDECSDFDSLLCGWGDELIAMRSWMRDTTELMLFDQWFMHVLGEGDEPEWWNEPPSTLHPFVRCANASARESTLPIEGTGGGISIEEMESIQQVRGSGEVGEVKHDYGKAVGFDWDQSSGEAAYYTVEKPEAGVLYLKTPSGVMRFDRGSAHEYNSANVTLPRIVSYLEMDAKDYQILSDHQGQNHAFVASLIVQRQNMSKLFPELEGHLWDIGWFKQHEDGWINMAKLAHTRARNDMSAFGYLLSPGEKSTLMYSHQLHGRREYIPDFEDEVVKKTTEETISRKVAFDGVNWTNEQYLADIKVCLHDFYQSNFENLRAGSGDFPSFWMNRFKWIVKGASGMKTEAIRAAKDYVVMVDGVVKRLKTENNKAEIADADVFAEVAKEALSCHGETGLRAKPNEPGGKNRVLFPGNFFHFVFTTFTVLEYEAKRKGATRLHWSEDSTFLSFMAQMADNEKTMYMHDYADHNNLHSSAELGIALELMHDASHSDPITCAIMYSCLIRSLRCIDLYVDSEIVGTAIKGLLTGWRDTSDKNNAFCHAYIMAAMMSLKRMGMAEGIAEADMFGDDVKLEIISTEYGEMLFEVLNMMGIESQLSKQLIKSTGGEFLRTDQSGGRFYMPVNRMLHGAICGNLERSNATSMMKIGSLYWTCHALIGRGMHHAVAKAIFLAGMSKWGRTRVAGVWRKVDMRSLLVPQSLGGAGIPHSYMLNVSSGDTVRTVEPMEMGSGAIDYAYMGINAVRGKTTDHVDVDDSVIKDLTLGTHSAARALALEKIPRARVVGKRRVIKKATIQQIEEVFSLASEAKQFNDKFKSHKQRAMQRRIYGVNLDTGIYNYKQSEKVSLSRPEHFLVSGYLGSILATHCRYKVACNDIQLDEGLDLLSSLCVALSGADPLRSAVT
jgi:hypothetical protein